MFATIILEPPNRRQIELIGKIMDELAKLFGDKIKEKNFVRNYVDYNDGRPKQVSELARILENLRELVAKKDRKRIQPDPDPEYLLPGEGPAPENI